MTAQITRKLTTILAADAERFSTAMEADEVGTFGALKSARAVFQRLIERHGGRIANTAGDGLIADFPSVVEAVHCAIAVQQDLAAEDNGLNFRIGIHLGDVICDGDDLIGEGVNLAARLQAMAEPGGILISRQVYEQVHNKLTIGFEYLGEQQAKNLPEEIDVYRISIGAQDAQINRVRPKAKPTPRKRPSKVAQVWNDNFDSYNSASDGRSDQGPDTARFSDRPFGPLTPDQIRKWRWIGGLVGGAVALNVISGGGFWVAWPLWVLTFLYCFRHGETTLGLRPFKTIPVRIWLLMVFLIGINIMSFSGPWAIFPVGALLAYSFLLRGSKPAEE